MTNFVSSVSTILNFIILLTISFRTATSTFFSEALALLLLLQTNFTTFSWWIKICTIFWGVMFDSGFRMKHSAINWLSPSFLNYFSYSFVLLRQYEQEATHELYFFVAAQKASNKYYPNNPARKIAMNNEFQHTQQLLDLDFLLIFERK